MTLTAEQCEEMAQALYTAEAQHTPIEPFTISHPDADIEDAYRIAQLVTELKVAAGRSIKGHKVGLTSKAMQQLTGASEPDYGTLTDDWIVPEGSVVDMTRLNRPLVEVEIAFVLGHDLSGSFIKAIPFAAGDTITAMFNTLGDVTFATSAPEGPR